MKKIIKGVGIFLIGIILFISISYINHRVQLFEEEDTFIPNGKLVEVNGHSLHIHSKGEGDTPLVFMSGGGTSSPVLDFKMLYSQLSDDYRIVVVEKAGYGFSDDVDVDRELATILSETRTALSKADIQGPYILLPHSMSGIEALYWAQEHPNEVRGIIGLDMATPEIYEDYEMNMPLIRLSAFAANVGITRWVPGLAESDAMKYGELTEEDKDLYRTIFYRRTMTTPMLNEIREIKQNAQIVENSGVPEVSTLLFSSNGEGTGWSEEDWINHQENYANKIDGKLIQLDASHYIHNIEYEIIADEIKIFIQSLN